MDGNMIIILAALLCALIIALGLNSVVRCAVQWGRRLAFEMPEESATRSAATSGLKKQALRRLPVAVYGPGAGVLATECPICLAEFADGEEVRVLPWCHHGFHIATKSVFRFFFYEQKGEARPFPLESNCAFLSVMVSLAKESRTLPGSIKLSFL
ncbi:hypothetical protein ZIOFF_007709 [Zingiber officinale]|uniref:RING-type domain-containing protein n=1 Tax=Zingiber officinale TaxID=94328 RepID=A0A8J5M458_ZINOF|nr:hypothetical protein ZIOFF_007709 [Zingiber officinale]